MAPVAATVAPMSLPSLALRSTWVLGLSFPRMMDWEEARTLAEVVGENQLDGRLVYVYNHSFAPALAVFTPITVERGHWVEVQPRPDPSDWVSAGVKAYVMPLPPGDAMLRELEQDGLLTIHGGSEKSSVMTLTRAGDLESVASLVSGIMEQESLRPPSTRSSISSSMSISGRRDFLPGPGDSAAHPSRLQATSPGPVG